MNNEEKNIVPTEADFSVDTTEALQREAVAEEVKEEITEEAVNPSENEPIYRGFNPTAPLPKTYTEKVEIKGAAITVGIVLIVQLILILVLNLTIVIVHRVTNGAFPLYDPAILQVVQILFSIFAFTLPFVLIPKIRKYRISDLIEFKMPQKGTFLPFFLFGIGFCAFANVACSYASALFEGMGVEYEVDFGDNPTGFFGFMLSFIATVITPALVEEFAFRGVVQGILKKYGTGFAIVTSSLLFGLMHGNFEQIPFAFLVGLGIGFAVEKCSSIWVGVAIHAFNNSISIFFEYILKSSAMVENIVCSIIFLGCMLAGLAAFLLLGGKEKELLALEGEKLETKEAVKYKYFFLSAPIVAFTIVSLLEALTFFV